MMQNKIFVISLLILTNLSAQSFATDKSCSRDIEIVIVNGTSMSPQLKDKEEVSLDKNFYSCNQIKRGDIIVFEIPGRKNRIIKKVYAIPGDKFEYKNGHIYINGKIAKNSVNQEYKIESKMLQLYATDYPQLPKDSYLVLGDEPHGTFDASKMGFIDRKQIVGHVGK